MDLESRVFSKEASKELSDRYVAVRLTGGNDITPEVESFMKRYGVRGYPTLYVMNAEGHVVVPQVGRSVPEMLSALALGEKRETEFAALVAKREGPEERKAYIAALRDRMLWDDLMTALREEVAIAPTAEVEAELASQHARAGDHAAERAALEAIVAKYKDAPERIKARMRLATMDTDPSGARSREEWVSRNTKAAEALGKLLGDVQAENDAAAEIEVRMGLANLLAATGKADDAFAHMDWVLENHPKSKHAPGVLMAKANSAWSKKDWAAAKALLERIVADYPASEEAQAAPRGIAMCQKQIDNEAAAPKEPAGPEKQ